MEERSIAPGLLLAMPQLNDPNFERAVVLMIDHTEQGSFGLIANRPTTMKVSQVVETLGVEWRGDPAEVVWTGGPVMPHTGWLLHGPTSLEEAEGTVSVTPGIQLSTSPEQLKLVATDPPRHIRFLIGYSGWGASQLEGELAAGAWLCAEAVPELLFATPAERMWEAALMTLGVDPISLVQGSGVH